MFDPEFLDSDKKLSSTLADFLPEKIYDFHLHFYREDHYSRRSWARAFPVEELNQTSWRNSFFQLVGRSDKTLAGLAYGVVGKDSLQDRINPFIQQQTADAQCPWSRCLYLAAPHDNQEKTAHALLSGAFSGLKVYHVYADRPDTFNATIPEYAPEWMWELLNEVRGVMLLHIVRPEAIADQTNQRDIKRLCAKYPRVQLVLAHVARSFSHRHALRGLPAIADLPNIWVDTSAVCEAQSFLAAFKILGPKRILYGSDYPVSVFRGRCVTMSDTFHWHYSNPTQAEEKQAMTHVGIESLLALREAAEEFGATQDDLKEIFWDNALRCLNIPSQNIEKSPLTGAAAWQRSREVISCGTGLLSKRAESFLTPQWPTYFSKAQGCRIWDADGRLFKDFVGGVGAVFLGYADPEVNRAVSRRLNQGNYCSLLAREEVELAEHLLHLHPSMTRLRYARGGGEAMSVAVRIARAAKGKSGVAFCGYHGWQDWYLAANLPHSGLTQSIPGLNPQGVPRELAGTAHAFAFNQVESLRKACHKLGDNLAAIVMEPMRAEIPTPEFLAAVHEIKQKQNLLLVIDEVTSGLRYGFPGVSAQLGWQADLLVYAKAMSNGIPFGVVLGTEPAMQGGEASFISSSYWTDGLGPAAALAVLTKMQRESIFSRVWRKGEHFINELRRLAAQYPTMQLTISGSPTSPALDWGPSDLALSVKKRVIEAMLAQNILLGSIIYLMDSHTDEDITSFLTAFQQALDRVSEEKSAGRLSVVTEQPTTIGRLA